jgi:hypothetical protein
MSSPLQTAAPLSEDRHFGRDAVTSNYRFHLISSTLFRTFGNWRAKCGDDAEALYIYTAFMLAAAAEAVKAMGSTEDQGEEAITATVSACSVSDMTGIPRETARRKLLMLVERQMLQRGPGASYSLVLDRRSIRAFVERVADFDIPHGWEARQ